jgi:hypothetical protein
MNGGLWSRSVSRLALVAAASVFAGGVGLPSAKAADLGGDCCADLEERVAELEATTARKGNRKVSLTISGQVNRAILIWDDGKRSNAAFGLDNSFSSTRIGLTGDAKISPTWKAGFSILMDIASVGGGNGARSFRASQNMSVNNASATNGDAAWRVRDANFWIESSQLGRLTVGRLTGAGPVDTIDIGGISVIGSTGPSGFGGNLFFRRSDTGALSNVNLDFLTNRFADYDFRQNGIKYTSPTFAGFVFTASGGTSGGDNQLETQCSGGAAAVVACTTPATRDFSQGQIWGVSLQYAAEFSGFRVAAGAGYEHAKSDNFPTDGFNPEAEISQWGASGAVMHVPTGLFVQGDYIHSDRAASLAFTSLLSGFGPSSEMWNWDIQGGISKNWFGLGNTRLYGEYGVQNGWGQDTANPLSTASCGQVPCGIEASFASEVRFWGVGAVQTIDAAAMDLYVGYRHFDPDATSCAAVDATGTKCVVAGPKTPLQALDIVGVGSRIKF